MRVLVGFAGAAGAGKSTAADLLGGGLQELGLGGAYTLPMAGVLKGMLRALLDSIGETPDWDDRVWKEAPIAGLGPSPRHLAQTLGTEWGRALRDDFWIRVMELQLAQMPGDVPILIPDIRFDNEAAWLRAAGGHIIQIVSARGSAVRAHASEAGINPQLIDATIRNDGTTQELRSEVLKVVAQLYGLSEQ